MGGSLFRGFFYPKEVTCGMLLTMKRKYRTKIERVQINSNKFYLSGMQSNAQLIGIK